jgi:hypothetical protein
LKGIEWNPEIDWKEEFKSLYWDKFINGK